MNKLAQWIYAYKVCKKYDIKWNPFFKLSHAEFQINYYKKYKRTDCTIRINLFYKGFLDSFLHEVGHILRHRRVYFAAESCVEYERKTSDILKEEYIAWKFAKRVLKGDFDKNRARIFFQSYWKRAVRDYGCVFKATDAFYSFDRYIEK